MFNKKDMMISVEAAESLVKEKEKEFHKELSEQSKAYNKILNFMKKNSYIKGIIKIHNNEFSIGDETPYYSNGIQLFTGDEVEFISGKRGVIVLSGDMYYAYTNAEISALRSPNSRVSSRAWEGSILGDHLKITKHFNELVEGEEIAKSFVVKEIFRYDKEKVR